jgi:hypothetical protein
MSLTYVLLFKDQQNFLHFSTSVSIIYVLQTAPNMDQTDQQSDFSVFHKNIFKNSPRCFWLFNIYKYTQRILNSYSCSFSSPTLPESSILWKCVKWRLKTPWTWKTSPPEPGCRFNEYPMSSKYFITIFCRNMKDKN